MKVPKTPKLGTAYDISRCQAIPAAANPPRAWPLFLCRVGRATVNWLTSCKRRMIPFGMIFTARDSRLARRSAVE
jgi:hypothetical protein